jgi:hypothetical protein
VRYFCLVLFFNLIIGSLFAQRALEINTRYGAGYRILGAKTDDSLLKDIINLRTREKPGVALDVSIMKISELSKSLNSEHQTSRKSFCGGFEDHLQISTWEDGFRIIKDRYEIT